MQREQTIVPVRQGEDDQRLQRDPDQPGQPREDPLVVVRRGHQARDDQLPDVQARARRPVLRQDLRARDRLGVLVRQVQAHEAPRRRVRQVRRRGHAEQGPARAHGAHRAGQPGEPRVVLQGSAEPHRASGRHVPARARAHPVLRGVRRDRSARLPRRARARDPERGSVPRAGGQVPRRVHWPGWGPRRSRSYWPAWKSIPSPRELREKMRGETSQQKRLKYAKRLKVVDAFRQARATGRSG